MQKLMQKSNSRQELLDNTINHFNSMNRSYVLDRNYINELEERCVYRKFDTCACAIGRELTNEIANKLDSLLINLATDMHLNISTLL